MEGRVAVSWTLQQPDGWALDRDAGRGQPNGWRYRPDSLSTGAGRSLAIGATVSKRIAHTASAAAWA